MLCDHNLTGWGLTELLVWRGFLMTIGWGLALLIISAIVVRVRKIWDMISRDLLVSCVCASCYVLRLYSEMNLWFDWCTSDYVFVLFCSQFVCWPHISTASFVDRCDMSLSDSLSKVIFYTWHEKCVAQRLVSKLSVSCNANASLYCSVLILLIFS